MDSLFSILNNKDFDEPPEIASIKKYVIDEFKADVSVQVSGATIVVTSSSSSLANTLRLRGPEIKRRCQIDKKLVFRIGK